MERQRISTGAPWEALVGYSRAIRAGDFIFVSGTTASGPDGQALYPGDAYGQTREILARIGSALHELGAELSDVVQTRIYVRDIKRWEEIGRAHGEVFRGIRPTTSMVEVSRLIDPTMLVEIEAVALVNESSHERD